LFFGPYVLDKEGELDYLLCHLLEGGDN